MEDNSGDQLFKIVLMILGGGILVKSYSSFILWLQNPSYQKIIIGTLLLVVSCFLILLTLKTRKVLALRRYEKSIFKQEEDSVYCGVTDQNEEVWIKPKQRTMHTQVIGTTNAGKSESVILPWAIQDIHQGKGLLLIDGKADNSLMDKIWSYTVLAGREKDFKLFSLSRTENSHQFNPLLGGTAEEITERVFNAFDFENPHYRSLQYEVMAQVMRIFEATNTVPTFQRLHHGLNNPKTLEEMVENVADTNLKQWASWFASLPSSDRENRTSGLLTAIGHFALGANAKLYNPADNAITIDDALKNNQIVYFQLPVLLAPFLGKATGRLVLQSLQAAVANRHRSSSNRKFFSVFLDDFSEYLYEGFVSILNKSRSANIGIVFAHQALGDITVLGDAVANSIMTNSNLKVFMRGNDPNSAEHFSKTIGTGKAIKYTERQKKGRLGIDKSGDVSARDVEEFLFNPNLFKRELGVGEAIFSVPHNKGAKVVRIKFNMIDDLPPVEFPKIEKSVMPPVVVIEKQSAKFFEA